MKGAAMTTRFVEIVQVIPVQMFKWMFEYRIKSYSP